MGQHALADLGPATSPVENRQSEGPPSQKKGVYNSLDRLVASSLANVSRCTEIQCCVTHSGPSLTARGGEKT